MIQHYMRQIKEYRLVVLTLTVALIASVSGLAPAAGTAPTLDQTQFTAAGANETLLHIHESGRYSLQTQSPQGTRLELVDRMAGPMASAGRAGQQDGRLDVLLDKGTYKIRLTSHPQGSGELILSASAFHEVRPVAQPEDFPLLEPLRMESAELGDLQQQSFWLYLAERQRLRLEAIGRHLQDARLWRDGQWLVDAQPAISEYEVVAGRPQTYLEFFHDLNPGLYRLTCYGGEALAWANDAPDAPFHLRMGLPRLGANGQKIVTISPFGRGTFIVNGKADYFELSRRDKLATRLGVGSDNPQNTRYNLSAYATIDNASRDPWCSIRFGRAQTPKMVMVQGAPGDRVVLKYFKEREQYAFSENGEYWLSNQSSAAATDAIDVSAILARSWPGTARVSVKKARVFELGADRPLIRKFNLLGSTTLLLNVQDAGTYRISEDPDAGAKARYQIEPLLFSKPDEYQAPPSQLPGTEFELTRGFYVLSLRPRSKGILSFALSRRVAPEPGTLKPGAPQRKEPVVAFEAAPSEQQRRLRQRILWPQVGVSLHDSIFLNQRPEVASGLIVRRLPLDLDEPLPVLLMPGEQVPINSRIERASRLIVETEQDASFEVGGYAEPITSGSVLQPGRYTLTLKNTSDQVALFSVKTVSAQPAPRLPADELARRARQKQIFPVLTEANPLFRKFERNERQHFTVLVKEPGLYRLETSGRLATRLTVRTHFITRLFAAEQNGIGRNALVQQYLKPGEYQITVQTLGRSKGRAGVHLRRAALIEESGLRVGVLKKIHLPADEAVRYRFEIAASGAYRLRTLGLNKTFTWRLEDQAGWPLVRPNQSGVIERDFAAGAYHYMLLPEAVESRRLTVLDNIEPPSPPLEGKGPHPIRLNEPVEHEWREIPNRRPDVFVLELPDPIRATVHLSEDLRAALYREAEELGLIRGGTPRTFDRLTPGRYEIRVTSIEKTDRLPYTLRVTTEQLITGLRYTVDDFPASLNVSVGADSLVELFSFGATDVKATLWQDGRLVAQHDDMENDWNFRISQKLAAGAYQLRVEPVGIAPEEAGAVEIGMSKRDDATLPAQTLPFTFDTELSQDVLTIPLTTPAGETLAHIQHAGAGRLKFALFRDDRRLAEGEQSLFLVLRPQTDYTLLCWRLDDAEAGAVTLKAHALPAQEIALGSAPVSLSPDAISAQTDAGPGGWKLTNASKISYTLEGAANGLAFAPAVETPFTPVADVPLVMPQQSGWLLRKSTDGQFDPAAGKIGIRPFVLHEQESTPVRLTDAGLPFDFEHPDNAPVLLEIKSAGALVGAVIAPQAVYTPDLVNWPGQWLRPSRTFIAAPGKGAYRGRLWPVTGAAVKGKVLIKPRALSLTEQTALPADGADGTLEPDAALAFDLPASAYALDLVLSKGLVAFVWQADRATALAAAPDAHVHRLVDVPQLRSGQGGRLILLNTGAQPALYRITPLAPGDAAASGLAQAFDPAIGFERVFADAGRVMLNIPAGRDPLFVDGEHVTSRFFRQDGRLFESAGPSTFEPEGVGGRLEIETEAGFVRVWQSRAADKAERFFADAPTDAAQPLTDGVGVLADRPQRWSLTVTAPRLILAEADAPGMTAIRDQHRVLTTSVSGDRRGRQAVYFLAPGEYQLWTRPLTGLPQQGALRVRQLAPEPLESAQTSTWRLIAAGETQVFRFEVSAEADVGVGVQTESDELAVRLFDTDFQEVATGPLIFGRLQPGPYLLLVTPLPDAAKPVQYRPVVYGHRGSQQGIPDEVLEQYRP